jgi:hypothetical protein
MVLNLLLRSTDSAYMQTLFSLLFVAAMGVASLALARSPADDSRSKVVILSHGASIDGVARPDLSQAVTDSISSSLVRSGRYRVYEHTEGPRAPRRQKSANYAAASPAHPTGKAAASGSTEADYWFAHSLLGDAYAHRLTLKKIAATSGEVLAVEEVATTGGLDALLRIIPNSLAQLETRSLKVVAFPRTQSPAALREIIRPAISVLPTPQPLPTSLDESPGLREWRRMAETTPSEYGGIPLASIPKALIYQPLGAIEWINETWQFCIIHPRAGHRFAVDQPLDVLYDEDGRLYGSLKVDALDSGKVVAGFGRTPRHHPLYRGDVVYGWAPPLR